jgi:sialate O-acetylesterase
MFSRKLPLILALLLCAGACAHAGVNVVGLFRDNMVLQCDRPVPVWGSGTPGEKVTIEFLGATTSTEVDKAGNWMVKLGPFPAGGPYQMTITQGTASLTLTNLLVGEVWICSGQSNMQWGLQNMNKAAAEIAAAQYPTIRFITVTGTASTRQRVIPCGSLVWRECTPATAGELSAVAYFFARELQQNRHVPIGLIVTAQGASPIRSWISAETMQANPIFRDTLADYVTLPTRKQAYDVKRAAYDQALAKSKQEGTPPPPWPGSFEGDASPGPYFYGRVYPLAPFALRGVIWYQGENEAMDFQGVNHSKTYKDFFPVMIAEWRSLWGWDFPFLYVQLAPIGGRQTAPGESPWAEVREGQRRTLSVPNTAMVVTTDICEPELHPRKKVDLGRRLAWAARALAYGEHLLYSGPLFDRAEFKDGRAILSFTQVGSGLVAKDGPLTGFALAGADHKFVWGEAQIVDNTVVVSSAQVAQPQAVRYAWAENPLGNLFNQEGFPASCFRTDDW